MAWMLLMYNVSSPKFHLTPSVPHKMPSLISSSGGILFPRPLRDGTVPPAEFNTKTVSSILYVGVFASLSAFVLWNKAIVTVGPSKAGMIYYTLPLFSGLLAYLFLKEDIGIIHFYSALLIVSGILTANYESKKV
jgi:drug/metabolite transporter (DMT)-like permease